MPTTTDPEAHWSGSDGRAVERRALILLLAVYWILFQFFFFIYLFLSRPVDPVHPASLLPEAARYATRPEEVAIVVMGAALCFGIYSVLKLASTRGFWMQLPLAFATALAASALFTLMVEGAMTVVGVPWPPLTGRRFAIELVRWLSPLGLWTAVSIALLYNQQLRDRERRLSLVRIQAHEAQVRALRYQVNPHFLYNVLNSISALILDGRNELADAMVMRLSSFFRASLATDSTSDVPLADEFALQKLYLDIEAVRFEDALSVEVQLPRELERALVPSLILQPLVENALKHGVNDTGNKTVVNVLARREGEQLVIEVSDNGPGVSKSGGTGTGLENVVRRLTARFGQEARLDWSTVPGSGFTVRLSMPLQFA